MEKGEYDRALDLVEKLLMENPDDKEALELQDRVIAAKRGEEEAVLEAEKNLST